MFDELKAEEEEKEEKRKQKRERWEQMKEAEQDALEGSGEEDGDMPIYKGKKKPPKKIDEELAEDNEIFGEPLGGDEPEFGENGEVEDELEGNGEMEGGEVVDEVEEVEGDLQKKVKCKLSGHEIPANIERLKEHFEGKKYTMAKNCYSKDFSKYEPYIIEHKRDK